MLCSNAGEAHHPGRISWVDHGTSFRALRSEAIFFFNFVVVVVVGGGGICICSGGGSGSGGRCNSPSSNPHSVPVIDGSRGPFIIIGTSGKWPPSTPGTRRRGGGGCDVPPRSRRPVSRLGRATPICASADGDGRRGGRATPPPGRGRMRVDPPPLPPLLLQVEGRTAGERAGRLLRSRGGESLSGGFTRAHGGGRSSAAPRMRTRDVVSRRPRGRRHHRNRVWIVRGGGGGGSSRPLGPWRILARPLGPWRILARPLGPSSGELVV